MNVLIIAPHMDDEVLGCGGTIARHILRGDEVSVCIVANRAYEHQYDPLLIAEEKRCSQNAQSTLGYSQLVFLDLPDERLDNRLQDIIIPLENVYDEICPELVYVNFWGDLNQDHRAVFDASMVVLRPHSSHKPKRILVYEVPSSTDQVLPRPSFAFQPNFYVDITETIETKIAALNCYDRELRTYPHPRSQKGIEAYAQKRGTEIGFNAAEAFIIVRDEWGRES